MAVYPLHEAPGFQGAGLWDQFGEAEVEGEVWERDLAEQSHLCADSASAVVENESLEVRGHQSALLNSSILHNFQKA